MRTRRGHNGVCVASRRRYEDPMAAYDRLPRELRAWLAEAVLPWSPRSARRAWEKALARAGGNTVRASEVLSEIEARQLGRMGL